MINASKAFKEKLKNGGTVVNYADVLLSEGTILHLEPKNIMLGGCTIDDKTTDGKFGVGFVIGKTLSLRIANHEEQFSLYDFYNSIITLYIAMQLEDGTIEKIRKGVYYTTIPETPGEIVEISAADGIYKLDRDYTASTTIYPATLQTIITEACLDCGIPIGFRQFDNMSYVVQKKPEKATYRQVVSWACQIAGYNARIDNNGYMQLVWYDTSLLDHKVYDGGDFFEYPHNKVLDGGDFLDYSAVKVIDGGLFTDPYPEHIFRFKNLTVHTDDVVITGVQVVYEDTDVLFGDTGYVIKVDNNPFTEGKENQVADYLGQRMVGMYFRPFSGSVPGNPLYEPFDVCKVSDRKGNSCQSIINSVSYTIGSYTEIACQAEDPVRNGSDYFSDAARAVVEARRNTQKQLTEYDKAVQNMNQIAMNAMGFHTTYEEQPDGSRITYLHDKPNLSDSKIIYKQTIDGFFLSQDGGKSYTAGFDSQGNAVLNILYAIGIVADWIKTGRLLVKDADGVITMLADVDTGQVIINAESLAIQGKSIQDITQDAIDGQTQEDIFDKLTDGGKAQGMYIQNGQLYFNGQYIQARGLKVVDKNGTTTLYVNNYGQVTLNVSSLAITGKAASTQEYANSQANSALSAAKTYADSASKSAVNAQTQTDIFNKLTNNGALKGIYMLNGQLYINASYLATGYMSASRINGGTLYLGGNNNGNGLCIIRDANNNEIGRLSNEGINFLKGMIRLGSLFSVDTSGNVIANSLKSSNAQITGGTFNITSDKNDSAIWLKSYDGYFESLMSASGISFKTSDSVANVYYNGIGINEGDIRAALMSDPIGGSYAIAGTITALQKLQSKGTKSRIVNTVHYSERILYCYEMPSPMFGDIGTGKIDEFGYSYIYFEQIFQETIKSDMTYYAFLQKEGEGDLWVEEKTPEYFLVKGTPGLSFSWEVKAKQVDYEYERIEAFDESYIGKDIDYGAQASAYLENCEREILDYEKTN